MVSDGASYGNLGVDRSEVTAFQRWDYARPEFNLEVAVFPHGYIKNASSLFSVGRNIRLLLHRTTVPTWSVFLGSADRGGFFVL